MLGFPNPKKLFLLQGKNPNPCNNAVWGWRGHEEALQERPWDGDGQQAEHEHMVCVLTAKAVKSLLGCMNSGIACGSRECLDSLYVALISDNI